MVCSLLPPLTLALLLAPALAAPPPLAFWTFQETAAPYTSTGSAGPYQLLQGNASHPIDTIVPANGAPFGSRAAYFGPHGSQNNSARLFAPRDAVPAITEGLTGVNATVTIMAWVSVPSEFTPAGMVAGVWDEYGVEGGSTGARSYALFLDLGACGASGGSSYAKGLAAHISPVGGPTPGNRYCTTAACDSRVVAPSPAWHCLAGTYDGSFIRAFVNGTLVQNSWRNPFNLTGGIFGPSGLPGRVGAEFGVGANRINATVGAPPEWSNVFTGLLGGLAVWGHALAEDEVAQACALGRGFQRGDLPAGQAGLKGVYTSPKSTHTSAGVYAVDRAANRTTLVRTLWSHRATPPGEHILEWDGLDDEGVRYAAPSAGTVLTARVLAADVTYTWEGVIGNSVAQTGPRVPKGYSSVHGLSIAGDVAVLCAGYGERIRTMFAFNASEPKAASSFRSLGHMDYHSVYSSCATDGATAVFFNSNVPAPEPSYYHDNATFVVGYDLTPGLFDPTVPPICEHNYTVGGRLSCQDGTGQKCSVMWDGCNGHEQTYSSALDWNQSSLIPTNNAYGDAASGIAVQAGGALLLVLHGLAGELRAFDKGTGARLFTWSHASLKNARGLALSALPGEDSVWSITAGWGGGGGGGGVCRFSGLSSAAPLTMACPLPPDALLFPDALALSPDGSRLLVTDIAAASQQVKLFDAATGALLHTFGRPGGYLAPGADIALSPDRFWFSSVPLDGGEGVGGAGARSSASAVAWTKEGTSFWVTDHGNRRLLKLQASDGSLLDSLSWLLCSYTSAAIASEPSRVFSNFLEFSVDYTLPLDSPGAWSLTRNWGAGLNSSFFAWDYGVNTCDGWAFAGFGAGVVTIQDGGGVSRTFATVGYHPHGAGNCSDSSVAVVELVVGGSPAASVCTADHPLPPSGGLRVVHIIDARPHAPGALPDSLGTFASDGTLRYTHMHSNESGDGAFWEGIYARTPTFDAQGCASWLPEGGGGGGVRLIASYNVSANNSQSLAARGSMAQVRMPTTSGGYTAVLDASKDVNGGFHLGAVAGTGTGAPGAGWAWRASPFGTWNLVDNLTVLQPGNVSVNLRFIDPSTIDGRYGAQGSGTNFGGSFVMAEGSNLFYGFYGEGWYQQEANQMLHFHETGLFIGQFGLPAAPYPEGNTIYATAGVAGNTFSPSTVRATGGDGAEHLYILNNEETEHGGVHRWRVDGADTVRFLEVALLE